MVAEVITVGTEILLGNIVNTNAAYLAQKCADLGLNLYYQVVVGDNDERLKTSMELALKRSDVIILTGGLGPTEDDITKEIVAKVLGRNLVEDEGLREKIRVLIEEATSNNKNRRITENNYKQAQIIDGAIILDNENGTAPGLIVEDNKKIVVLLPGPPIELKPMFEEKVFPFLRKMQPQMIYSQTVKLCGIGESQVADEIHDLFETLKNPTVATYAKTGQVDLRITYRGESEKECKKEIKPVVRELKKRFEKKIFAIDNDKTLQEAVVDMLRDQGLTLALAESCTGGAIASRIVSVEGASDVFTHGFVTYSNKAKRKVLGVKKLTIKTNGAVSEKTAREMAKGGCNVSGADVCLSVTGFAGPATGDENYPVGTVFIGCHFNNHTVVKELHFSGYRDKIIESTVVYALAFLRDCILEGIEK